MSRPRLPIRQYHASVIGNEELSEAPKETRKGRSDGRQYQPQQILYQRCGGGRRVIRKKIGGD